MNFAESQPLTQIVFFLLTRISISLLLVVFKIR
mgnify:CR=1 FL=1